MPDSEWYYVRNWFKYQHYKDRRPPWIKLHRSIETDPSFQSLSEIDQYRLIKLWMLSSDMDGRFPHDTGYVRSRLRLDHLTHTDNLLARLEATGLISHIDVRGALPTVAITRQRQSRDRVENKEQKHVARAPFQAPSIEQVCEYGIAIRLSSEESRHFHDHFSERNWKPKGYSTQMVDWKCALRNWKRNAAKYSSTGGNGNGRPKTFEQIKSENRERNFAEAAKRLGLPQQPIDLLSRRTSH